VNDLGGSLGPRTTNNRYHEQKSRLRTTGMNVVILVENPIETQPEVAKGTILDELSSLQLNCGFNLVKTRSRSSCFRADG
jgi:ERCC4-type nuclease